LLRQDSESTAEAAACASEDAAPSPRRALVRVHAHSSPLSRCGPVASPGSPQRPPQDSSQGAEGEWRGAAPRRPPAASYASLCTAPLRPTGRAVRQPPAGGCTPPAAPPACPVSAVRAGRGLRVRRAPRRCGGRPLPGRAAAKRRAAPQGPGGAEGGPGALRRVVRGVPARGAQPGHQRAAGQRGPAARPERAAARVRPGAACATISSVGACLRLGRPLCGLAVADLAGVPRPQCARAAPALGRPPDGPAAGAAQAQRAAVGALP